MAYCIASLFIFHKCTQIACKRTYFGKFLIIRHFQGQIEACHMTCIYFFQKPPRQPSQMFWNCFQVLIQEIFQSFPKHCVEKSKSLNILDILTPLVSFCGNFLVQNCLYLFEKDYCTTKYLHVKRYERSNPQCIPKLRLQLHKNVKN